MNASEQIIKLKELKEIHGDLPVKVPVRQSDYKEWDDIATDVTYVHVPLTHERYFRIS